MMKRIGTGPRLSEACCDLDNHNNKVIKYKRRSRLNNKNSNAFIPILKRTGSKRSIMGITRNKTAFEGASLDQINRAVHYAKASLAMEGQKIPDCSEELIKKRLRRQISQKDFIESALRISARK
jgi:hypothetical protein